MFYALMIQGQKLRARNASVTAGKRAMYFFIFCCVCMCVMIYTFHEASKIS
jgi:hypothetical protein